MPDVGHEQNLYEAGESLAAPLFTTRTGTKVLLRHIDQEFLCLTIFSQVHYAILRIVQYSTNYAARKLRAGMFCSSETFREINSCETYSNLSPLLTQTSRAMTDPAASSQESTPILTTPVPTLSDTNSQRSLRPCFPQKWDQHSRTAAVSPPRCSIEQL
jgi:hypothetical protein